MEGRKFRAGVDLGQNESVRITQLQEDNKIIKAQIARLFELIEAGNIPTEKKIEELSKAELEALCADKGIETKGLNKTQMAEALHKREK